MSRFARILVAFDGSDPARNAPEAALDLALELEASIEVLAVEGALPRYAATIGEVDDAVRERERDGRPGDAARALPGAGGPVTRRAPTLVRTLGRQGRS
jgi:nucleotide-binding universal stress UspA family protein